MAKRSTFARFERTLERRCDAFDLPAGTARRKARRLYYILIRRYPRGAALRDKALQMQYCHRTAARFFEPLTWADRHN